MTVVLMQYLPQIYNNTLGEFGLYTARLTETRAQNVKTMFFAFDLTLT